MVLSEETGVDTSDTRGSGRGIREERDDREVRVTIDGTNFPCSNYQRPQTLLTGRCGIQESPYI